MGIDAGTGGFITTVTLESGSNTIVAGVYKNDHFYSDRIVVNGNFEDDELWVELVWSANFVDLDLYVVEPDGNTCWFGQPTTPNGGFLDVDDMNGYGPEHYYISSAEGATPVAGYYHIYVHYFSSHEFEWEVPFSLTVKRGSGTYGEYDGTFPANSDDASLYGPDNITPSALSWHFVDSVYLSGDSTSVYRTMPLPSAEEVMRMKGLLD